MRSFPLALGIVAAVLGLAAPAPAQVPGGDLSRDEARELAAIATDDPTALDQLRGAGSIDGEPVDLAEPLGTTDPERLEARLDALERALDSAPVGDADPAAARERAAEIVADYEVQEVRPAEIGGSDEAPAIDLDLGSLWVPLLILAGAAGAFLAYRLIRNREAAGAHAMSGEGAAVSEPSSELERRALEAERAGAFGEALRLRYGIALRELQEIGRVPAGPSVTASRVSRELADPRAERLVGTFERVAYGGREAAADDARDAREGWPPLVQRARASTVEPPTDPSGGGT